MGGRNRSLCHGSEERARGTFLRPQAWLENYPDFYSVNSSEATQILVKAEDILRFMAYGPLSLVGFPEQITDDPKTWDKVKPKGDLRGLPTAIVYNTKVSRPITPVHDLMKEPEVTDERLRAAVDYVFEAVTFRPPTDKESEDYLLIVKDSIAKVGKENGAFMGLSAIFLDRDALFRPSWWSPANPTNTDAPCCRTGSSAWLSTMPSVTCDPTIPSARQLLRAV